MMATFYLLEHLLRFVLRVLAAFRAPLALQTRLLAAHLGLTRWRFSIATQRAHKRGHYNA